MTACRGRQFRATACGGRQFRVTAVVRVAGAALQPPADPPPTPPWTQGGEVKGAAGFTAALSFSPANPPPAPPWIQGGEAGRGPRQKPTWMVPRKVRGAPTEKLGLAPFAAQV